MMHNQACNRPYGQGTSVSLKHRLVQVLDSEPVLYTVLALLLIIGFLFGG